MTSLDPSAPDNSVHASRDTIILVTVLYNCENYLLPFFECLARQSDGNFVLVAIDNNSTDTSLALAKSLGLQHGIGCVFIANHRNLGITGGYNQGIEWARAHACDNIVLANNDITFDDDLFRQIRLRAVVPGHMVWTCLAYWANSQKRWYGGGCLSYWRARGMHYSQSASEAILAPIRVSFAPACLLYVRGPVFARVGLMDDDYFVYYDDVDFCRRLSDADIPVIYDPQVSFRHHVGGSSGGAESPFFLRISTRNKFIYIRKHYRLPMRLLILAIAFASKLVQLLSPRRRRPTWAGLKDALAGRTGP